jgi:hypothetical protein
MQKLLTYVLMLFVCASCISDYSGRSNSTESRTLRNVHTVRADFNGDKVKDSIVLQIPRYWLDSGDFTRIVFEIAGQKKHAFDNPEGWVSYDKYRDSVEFLADLPGANINTSRLLSIIKMGDKDYRLLLFGLPGRLAPGKLFVFSIINGSVKVDYFGPFHLTQLADIDGDRFPEIIGKACYTRRFEDKPGFFSYSPYQVYNLKNGFSFNEAQTEQYNHLFYFGYAGPRCSEDTVVVKTADSTVIMPLETAKRIYSE